MSQCQGHRTQQVQVAVGAVYGQLCAGVECEDAHQDAVVQCDSVHANKPWPSVEHVDSMQDSQSCAGVQSVSDVQYA